MYQTESTIFRNGHTKLLSGTLAGDMMAILSPFFRNDGRTKFCACADAKHSIVVKSRVDILMCFIFMVLCSCDLLFYCKITKYCLMKQRMVENDKKYN